MPTIATNLPTPAWPRELGASNVAGRCATKDCATSTVAPETKPTAVEEPAASPQQSSLESVMATLRRALSAVSDMGRWLDHVGSAATVGVHAVSKQRAGIEIQTKEGDVVRINYASRTEVTAGAVQASGSDGSVSATQAEVSRRERLRVSVDGDLNADELKAIDDVLAKVDSLAEEFFAGDFDQAFAQAAAFNFDSEQLANVAVQLSQRQRVSVVATQVASLPPTTQPELSPELPTAPRPIEAALDPVMSEPVVAAPVILEPVISEPVTSEPVVSEPATTIVSEVPAPVVAPDTASQPVAADVVKAAVTNSIVRYIAKLTTTLHVTDNETRLGITFHSKLDVLLASIKAHKPDVGAPTDGAAVKLQDVAGKAAALA